MEPQTGRLVYTRTVWPRVLWQEEQGTASEKRGTAPDNSLRVFVPVETVVAPGDRLVRGEVESLPAGAWTVTEVRLRDYGSERVRHKEVRCR